MKLNIIAVGRMKKGPEKYLSDLYAKRLSWSLVLEEVVEKKSLKPAQMLRKEASLLLDKVPDRAFLIAMDQDGDLLSSRELAGKIGDWQNLGIRNLAIVIGGPNGLDKSILDRADRKISMGRMTWPHMLVRVMLMEQLYRAQCILENHPYNK